MKKHILQWAQPEHFMSVKRLSDIENGKVMPTLEEFFKLCMLYKIPEAEILLEKVYPELRKKWKGEIKFDLKEPKAD